MCLDRRAYRSLAAAKGWETRRANLARQAAVADGGGAFLGGGGRKRTRRVTAQNPLESQARAYPDSLGPWEFVQGSRWSSPSRTEAKRANSGRIATTSATTPPPLPRSGTRWRWR